MTNHLLLCLACLLLVLTAAPAVHGMSVEVERRFTFTEHPVFNAASYKARAIVDGETAYVAWVDDQLRGMVARIDPDGTVSTSVVISAVQEDSHNGIQIGIDEQGYLHVAGDMHHAPLIGQRPRNRDHLDVPWQYWVSTRPRDISAFAFVGDGERAPAGTRISYARFWHDRQGRLYLSYRCGVIGEGYVYGVLAGVVARYDAEARRWATLGGATSPMGAPATVWTGQGCPSSVTGYQSYTTALAFDAANRLHLAWLLFGNGSPQIGSLGAEYLCYASTADDGVTWQAADGSPIEARPITEADAQVVVHSREGDRRLASKYLWMALGPDGEPLLFYRDNGARRFAAPGPAGDWSRRGSWPGEVAAIDDGHGGLLRIHRDRLWRSTDGGATWAVLPSAIEGEDTYGHAIESGRDGGPLHLLSRVDEETVLWRLRLSP